MNSPVTVDTLFTKADQLEIEGNPNEAAKTYHNILHHYSPSPDQYKVANYKYGLHLFRTQTDKHQGVVFLKKSADSGYLEAQYTLGWIYRYGIKLGLKKNNPKLSDEYFKKSKESYEKIDKEKLHEDANAIYNLGRISQYGCCHEKNEKKAFTYYKEAAAKSYPPALNNLGWFYLYKENCTDLSLTTEARHQKAFECFRNAADLENPYAYFNLGVLFLRGIHVQRELTEARNYFKQAESIRHELTCPLKEYSAEGKYALGFIYYEGLWKEGRNIELAKKWLKEAIEFNQQQSVNKDAVAADAYFLLGKIYELDENNIKKAKECYDNARIRGHQEANDILNKINSGTFFQDNIDCTRIHQYAATGDKASLQALVDEHPYLSLNTPSSISKKMPLHFAVECSQYNIVKYLLNEQGVNTDVLDEENNNPLHLAMLAGNIDIIRLLLRHNLRLCYGKNIDGDTPIDVLYKNNKALFKKLFVEKSEYTKKFLYEDNTLCIDKLLYYAPDLAFTSLNLHDSLSDSIPDDIVLTLIEKSPKFSLSQLNKIIDFSDYGYNFSRLDNVVNRLTQMDIKKIEQTEGTLSTLMQWYNTNATLKVNNKIYNLANAYPEDFLTINIKQLLKLIVKIQKNQLPNFSSALLSKLKTELLYECEMLRIRKDYLLITQKLNSKRKFIEAHASNILNKIVNIQEDQNYGFNAGFKDHAIYINFTRKNNTLIMRIDNLGKGVRDYHPASSQEDYFYPFVATLPYQELSQEKLKKYLSEIIECRTQSAEAALPVIYSPMQYGFKTLPKDDIKAENIPARKVQTSENCVLENFSVGLQLRLGDDFMPVVTEIIKELSVDEAKNNNSHFSSYTSPLMPRPLNRNISLATDSWLRASM